MDTNTDPVRAHDELRVQAALLRTPEFMAQFDPEKFARQLERIAAALASAPTSAPVGVDAVMVPKEPSEGVLVSMAIRYDHGLGVPGYYDHPLFGGENGGHKRRMESTVAKMRQLYEEVVGAGFYSREREEEYAAIAQQQGGAE